MAKAFLSKSKETEHTVSNEELHNLMLLAEVSVAVGQTGIPGDNKPSTEKFESKQYVKRYSCSSNFVHQRQVHQKLNQSCPQCGKKYNLTRAYEQHLKTHLQEYICYICGKRFSRPFLLKVHLRSHTGEKPYKCTVCNHAFADRSNFRTHVQTHSMKKPHICHQCGKAFKVSVYLKKHQQSSCKGGQLISCQYPLMVYVTGFT